MKKKIFAIIMALCMTVSLSAAAFVEDEINIMTTENATEIIPVYGYVGPDSHIIPPNPEEPDTELEIYVELPTHIIFAAFENHMGTVTSPKFKITNLSSSNSVKVEIEQFEQRSTPAIDLDGGLLLELLNAEGQCIIPDLFPADYSEGKLLSDGLSKYIDESTDNQLEFTIGGSWSGSFETELQPIFDMTIKFSAIE